LLGFSQLFLTFAPFDWLMRLFKSQPLAIIVTAILAVGVMAMKIHAQAIPLSAGLLSAVLIVRFVAGLLTVIFYLRGGILLAWWWAFLLEARHWADFI